MTEKRRDFALSEAKTEVVSFPEHYFAVRNASAADSLVKCAAKVIPKVVDRDPEPQPTTKDALESADVGSPRKEQAPRRTVPSITAPHEKLSLLISERRTHSATESPLSRRVQLQNSWRTAGPGPGPGIHRI